MDQGHDLQTRALLGRHGRPQRSHEGAEADRLQGQVPRFLLLPLGIHLRLPNRNLGLQRPRRGVPQDRGRGGRLLS